MLFSFSTRHKNRDYVHGCDHEVFLKEQQSSNVWWLQTKAVMIQTADTQQTDFGVGLASTRGGVRCWGLFLEDSARRQRRHRRFRRAHTLNPTVQELIVLQTSTRATSEWPPGLQEVACIRQAHAIFFFGTLASLISWSGLRICVWMSSTNQSAPWRMFMPSILFHQLLLYLL